MRTASVSELKARLSHYLREVRRGGEVQILDRGVPIARLTGIPSGPSDEHHRQRLVQAGVLRPGEGNSAVILGEAPLELAGGLSSALDEDRRPRV